MTFEYLLQKGLIRLPVFQHVTLTEFGIETVEKDMAQSYAEKEYMVLKALFEKTNGDDVTAAEMAKLIPVPENDIYYIFKDFERKGWCDEFFEDTARITDLGVTALNKWDTQNSTISPIVYNTNNYGNAINQIGGQGNVLYAHQTNNPKFDEAVRTIIDLINASNLPPNDKQDALTEIRAINQIATQEKTEVRWERAKLKITAFETLVKAVDLGRQLAPYIVTLYDHFK